MNRAVWVIVILAVLAFILGVALGLYIGMGNSSNPSATKTVTVEKTVPGPERTVEHTVYKRKPGVTTWIIVCGETTQKVVNNKPSTECKLPNTGGGEYER